MNLPNEQTKMMNRTNYQGHTYVYPKSMCIQLDAASIGFSFTVKTVLTDHYKIDKKQS